VRVIAALTTIPGWRTWGRCALVYLIFLICAVPIGMSTGLLRPGLPHAALTQMLATSLIVLVHPAFVEELIFRVILLPRDAAVMRRGRLLALAALALTLYVASHPINAMIFRPQVLGLFTSVPYLTITALLGVACTVAYFISRSIWPPVLIHWLTVVLWLWLLGGEALLC
jgi:predicted Abi (CAAX) family protease